MLGLRFANCWIIRLGLGKLAKNIGYAWYAGRLLYLAAQTRGHHLESATFDFKDS